MTVAGAGAIGPRPPGLGRPPKRNGLILPGLPPAPRLPHPAVEKELHHWMNEVRDFVAGLPAAQQELENWDPARPVAW